MEPLGYAPKQGEPVCGWWLVREDHQGKIIHQGDYCPRYVEPGNLCPKHEAEYASMANDHEGEEPHGNSDPGAVT